MFFLFINNDTFYMKPINIVEDIKQILVCDMKKNKIEKIINTWHIKINQKAADSKMDDLESNQKF